MIMCLSPPAGRSVNDGIHPDDFSLHYSSVDDAVAIFLHLGKGALMAKFILMNQYRNSYRNPYPRINRLPFSVREAGSIYWSNQKEDVRYHGCGVYYFILKLFVSWLAKPFVCTQVVFVSWEFNKRKVWVKNEAMYSIKWEYSHDRRLNGWLVTIPQLV